MVLLDTDHVSLLQAGTGDAAERLAARLADAPPGEVATTIITYEEQTRGWLAYLAKAKSVSAQVEAYRRLKRHSDFYRNVILVPFDEQAATVFQRLQRSRIRIGTMDLRIAAIALARDELLLTRNRADFEKVPGFSFEDWTR